MSNSYLVLCIVLCGWRLVLGEEPPEGRHFSKHKCYLGSCGGGLGFGGYQVGYQGGYQSGYQGYPPINIGISQSQSSASGGYGTDFIPPYNQYNQYNGLPNNGPYSGNYNNGYRPYNKGYGPNNNVYGSYNNGFGPYNNGYGPYNNNYGPYNNGFGPYNKPFGNNQFNGNYYLGNTGNGYGLQRFGDANENDEETSDKETD